jgi:hypothetical protein
MLKCSPFRSLQLHPDHQLVAAGPLDGPLDPGIPCHAASPPALDLQACRDATVPVSSPPKSFTGTTEHSHIIHCMLYVRGSYGPLVSCFNWFLPPLLPLPHAACRFLSFAIKDRRSQVEGRGNVSASLDIPTMSFATYKDGHSPDPCPGFDQGSEYLLPFLAPLSFHSSVTIFLLIPELDVIYPAVLNSP